MRIQQLSPLLANQIAAGEVIERPASVVKELLENSLDAGATQIEIDIEKGGVQRICIRDNGAGIHQEDLPLALARHATSKVQQLADLEKLLSLGFRGEALASIAAVSRLTLTSKTADQPIAFVVQAEGREREIKITPASHPTGTTVDMQDLFFNTPARRKFLRSEKTEFDHIETIVRRILLARFDVGITLRHNQKTLLQLRPQQKISAREKRISKICGSIFSNHATHFEMTTASLCLQGWIATADVLRMPADLQYFYVNGRMIRDKLINHAIRQAYQQHFLQDRSMTYVLYLDLPPQLVDVNVHPTKHEVRFRDGRTVHDFIVECLSSVFNNSNDSQQTSLDLPSLSILSSPKKNTLTEQTVNYFSKKMPISIGQVQESMANYAILANHDDTTVPLSRDEERGVGGEDFEDLPHKTALSPNPSPMSTWERGTDLGFALAQLHDRYILAQNGQGLVIINRFLAQTKIIYGQLLEELQQGHLISQPLLMPITLTLTTDLSRCVEQYASQLASLGIEVAIAGPDTIIVRHLPNLLRGTSIANLLPALLKQLKEKASNETLLVTLATQSVSSENKILTLIEMNELIKALQQYDHLHHTLLPEKIYQQIVPE